MKIIPISTAFMSPSFLLRRQIEEEIMEYFNSSERLLREVEITSTEREVLAILRCKGEQFAST